MKTMQRKGSSKTKAHPDDNYLNLIPYPDMLKIPLNKPDIRYWRPDKSIVKSIQPQQPVDKSKGPVKRQYIKKISADLSFSEDVVKEKCFHMLPYDEKYFWEVLDVSDIIYRPPKSTIPIGRHNSRGSDIRHVPCSIAKETKRLKPLKSAIAEKAVLMHKEALEKQHEFKSCISEDTKSHKSDVKTLETISEKDHEQKTSVFLTEVKDEKEAKDEKKVKEQAVPPKSAPPLTPDQPGWDAYLLSIISPLTAKWVVHEKTPASLEKEKLAKVVTEWYGPPTTADLVPDNISEGDSDDGFKKKKEKKLPKTRKLSEMNFLERMKAENRGKPHKHYAEDNDAPFYRQPAGLRRQFKNIEKEEAGYINSTAHNIEVKTYKPPPPPTLKDFINPKVGKHVYLTENRFQQEWLTGCKQVYQPGEDTTILMECQNKFKKQLRREYPELPEHWHPETEKKKKPRRTPHHRHITTIKKGSKRWKELPEPYDDTSEVLNIAPPGYDPEFHRSPDPKTRRIIKLNTSLVQIIDEWRAKWHLSGQFADSTTDDLIQDMTDLQSHVRLKAIVTAGKAAEYKPPSDQGITLDYEERRASVIDEKIFLGLDCLLDDSNDRVKKTAAITLYSLNHPTPKAESILRKTLFGQTTIERWTAAQCLAHFGICDSDVVGEIITQLLTTEDSIKHEQGIHLLAKISNNSTLVHCMVAEQLNSSSWRHRVIACKILPTLHGTINKDITLKLSELMWNDWHSEVRKAAAQCLGKTQHGREVHDELKNRIASGSELVRLEAISRIGQLGIMTAKLLPPFLKCFDDPYMSIRLETCITSGNLHIKDEQVVSKLVHIASFDSVWKVKATAIQALGKIGVTSEKICDCLLWALRYEEKPTVRAEACHTLMLLEYDEDEMIEVLQDRLLVESSKLVRDEMLDALYKFGVNSSDDMDMVAQIKMEVRKLCTRNIIATHIMKDEMDETKRENIARLIYESDKELERVKEQSEVMFDELSRRDSLKSAVMKTEDFVGSPQPSRESTAFSLSADKELEDIMTREDTNENMSRENFTESSKSRTISGKSLASSASKSQPGTSDLTSSGKSGDGTKSTNENQNAEDDEEKASNAIPLLEVSEVRTSSNLSTKAGVYANSVMSIDDIGRLSRMSMGRASQRKALLSRDTQIERDKIASSSMRTFLGLDARYSDMLPLLDQIDRGFSALDPPAESSQGKVAGDGSYISQDSSGSSILNLNIKDSSSKSEDFKSESFSGSSSESADDSEAAAHSETVENIRDEIEATRTCLTVPTITIDTASECDFTSDPGDITSRSKVDLESDEHNDEILQDPNVGEMESQVVDGSKMPDTPSETTDTDSTSSYQVTEETPEVPHTSTVATNEAVTVLDEITAASQIDTTVPEEATAIVGDTVTESEDSIAVPEEITQTTSESEDPTAGK